MILELLIVIVFLLIIYHLYVYKKLHYHFEKAGVKYKPGVPIFGNTLWSTFAMRHVIEDIDEVYKEFPDERYVGYMEGTKKVILVKDPELMKMITIKEFDHFANRKQFFPKEIDPLLGCSLIAMTGEDWREMKSQLSPAFTSSKLKQMVLYMAEISNSVVQFLKDHQSEDIDVTDLLNRYNTDVIATTIFGICVNSVRDRQNEFFRIGHSSVNLNPWRKMYYFLTLQFPIFAKIMQFLGIPLFSRDDTEFFRKVVADTIEYRKKNNIVRVDFIHLLTEALTGNLNTNEESTEKDLSSEQETMTCRRTREWSLDQIAGQTFFAFVASFETSSSQITMCLHELALHQEYQEKMYQEVKAHHAKENELNHDNISELKYLTCVINETSRKWSAAIMLDRVCSKPYILPPPREGGKPYKVNPNDIVYNVVNSTHMNPEYHPDPHVFSPDRFLEENKHKIKPFTFMPFGVGPRGCLATRYEMLNMKVILYHIVLHYKILKCKRTQEELRLEPNDFAIRVLGGTYLQFKVNPNDIVYNVVNSTHMNPEYHPDPHVFSPDRFLGENKHKIKPFTFMPFGVGPRGCLASRYEMLNMKVILYHIVLHYKILRCKRTQEELRLEPNDFAIRVLGGTYLQFKARN